MNQLSTITVALITCGCGGSTGPAAPSPTTSPSATTIAILGERGAQSFSPNPARAAEGVQLVWRNNDALVHRIVFNDGSLDTGRIAPGGSSVPMRLAADGANYHCTIHPSMVGSISSSSGSPPPCEGVYCP